jgi:vitamin B12/bleomycin/antimicrobial peptide transport system ATP-binding/permease protein
MARRLLQLIFEQQRRETDLRYGLFRVRDNAEGVALYGGDRRRQPNRVERARPYIQTAEYWYATGFSADRP